MRKYSFRLRTGAAILGGCSILVTIISLVLATTTPTQIRAVRAPNGRVIKLQRYEFAPGTVRYELPIRPGAALFSKLVPDAIQKRFQYFQPELTCFTTPEFRKEPMLSVAFWSWDSAGHSAGSPGTRLVVGNEHGQVFDNAINYGAGGPFEVNAFPRRGRELRLRLMNGDQPLGEFTIANPCPGPYPHWTPAPIPSVVTSANLEITLERFTADATKCRTRLEFRIRENGLGSVAWLPTSFEILDATGNHWRPPIGSPPIATSDGHLNGDFLGALWPEEDAWKLRLDFKHAGPGSTTTTTRSVEFLVKPEQLSAAQKRN